MILIIGGSHQGKKVFALKQFGLTEEDVTDGRICKPEEACSRPILYNLHLLVERLMVQGVSPQQYMMAMLDDAKELIVICDEIGLGVVPTSADERMWREEVGRLLCEIAGMSDQVYRVYCGIPSLIKGGASQ